MKESQKKKDKKKAQREAKEAAQKSEGSGERRCRGRIARTAAGPARCRTQEAGEFVSRRKRKRKAREDEKAKKDEERRRRQAEERERQLDVERKRREKERRLDWSAKPKRRRSAIAKKRSARPKKSRQRLQREKAEKELEAKKELERKAEAAKKEKEARAQAQRESKQAAAAAAAAQSRGSSGAPTVPSSPRPAPRQLQQVDSRHACSRSQGWLLHPRSPAAGTEQAQSRGVNSQRNAIGSKSVPGAVSAAAAVPAVLLPHRPLQDRLCSSSPRPASSPVTAVQTPSGSSSQTSSVSVAANAGLPRPPVNVAGSGSASAVQPALGFGSIAPNAAATVPISTPKAPGSSISPKPAPPFAPVQDKANDSPAGSTRLSLPSERRMASSLVSRVFDRRFCPTACRPVASLAAMPA